MRAFTVYVLVGILEVLGAAYFGGPAWVLTWFAANSFFVGIVYAVRRPEWLGKRADGTRPVWVTILLAPYFVTYWLVWHGFRAVTREDPFNEIAPGVYVGRRLRAHELPAEIALVVDLTAEFVEEHAIRTSRAYRCLRIADGATAPSHVFRDFVREIAGLPGPVYIHCVFGHGRAPMAGAALLVARGLAPDAETALAMVRARRAVVHMYSAQKRMVQALEL